MMGHRPKSSLEQETREGYKIKNQETPCLSGKGMLLQRHKLDLQDLAPDRAEARIYKGLVGMSLEAFFPNTARGSNLPSQVFCGTLKHNETGKWDPLAAPFSAETPQAEGWPCRQNSFDKHIKSQTNLQAAHVFPKACNRSPNPLRHQKQFYSFKSLVVGLQLRCFPSNTHR